MWLYKPGRNTRQAINLIREHVESWEADGSPINICLWTGTCDFTRKIGKFIEQNDTTVDDLQEQYDRLLTLCKNRDSKLSILEIPPISITNWNRHKGHSNADIFRSQDQEINDKIVQTNELIRNWNANKQIMMPKIHLDLHKTRTSNRKISINYNLLTDGIHPTRILCKVWVRRLLNSF